MRQRSRTRRRRICTARRRGWWAASQRWHYCSVSVGLYGVVAYSVSQRTREIGVRMALGAQTQFRLSAHFKGGRVVDCRLGIVIGLGCSVAAATLIRGLLFGVRSWDVPTLAAVAAVLGLSALVASYIPARRAASVDPVEALRVE